MKLLSEGGLNGVFQKIRVVAWGTWVFYAR